MALNGDAELEDSACDPDLWLHRQHTLALLRRYMRLSVEAGRLPSLLGREFFRMRISNASASSVEDAVIFVHDVERALEKLNEFEQRVIAVMVLQEYGHDQAARILGCQRQTLGRRLPETLDRLSQVFLWSGLLRAFPKSGENSSESLSRG